MTTWRGRRIYFQVRSGKDNYSREVYYMWKEMVTVHWRNLIFQRKGKWESMGMKTTEWTKHLQGRWDNHLEEHGIKGYCLGNGEMRWERWWQTWGNTESLCLECSDSRKLRRKCSWYMWPWSTNTMLWHKMIFHTCCLHCKDTI